MSRNRPARPAGGAGPVVAAALAFACAAMAPAHARSTPPPPTWIDAGSYLQDDDQIDAWYALARNLRRNFDEICGDTFCESEYTNLQSMRFTCSVHRVTGRIGDCGWTFAASAETIDPRRGRIHAETPGWLCLAPLAPGTSIESLLQALQGGEPLYATLPRTHRTLFEGLVDCL